MITRQKIVSFGIPTAAAATIVAAALLSHGTGTTTTAFTRVNTIPSHPTGDQHQIDVVFAVDTTGSMGGLLDGAKRTVWSIASHIRDADPNADLRIGLVAYRDVGDDYVTRPFSLTTDLDAVYTELSTYTASGGGDVPEDVDAALDDAVHKMSWRTGAKKLMFVVGDAPPASRGEVPRYDTIAREAAEGGITINTIRCGTDSQTAMTFGEIAKLGNGEFSTIEQDGGVQQVATPYDAELAELSNRIDSTVVIVGSDGARERYHKNMAAVHRAAPVARADRATYYAKGKSTRGGDADLVGRFETGTVDLDDVPAASLPDDLRGKDKAQIKAEVEQKLEQRKQLQAKVRQLTEKRTKYLETHAADEGEGGFDAKVKATVERQLKH